MIFQVWNHIPDLKSVISLMSGEFQKKFFHREESEERQTCVGKEVLLLLAVEGSEGFCLSREEADSSGSGENEEDIVERLEALSIIGWNTLCIMGEERSTFTSTVLDSFTIRIGFLTPNHSFGPVFPGPGPGAFAVRFICPADTNSPFDCIEDGYICPGSMGTKFEFPVVVFVMFGLKFGCIYEDN